MMFSLSLFGDTGSVTVRDVFVQELKAYLGTPYRYGGLSASGIDCSGLLYQAALQSLHIRLPRTVSAMQHQFDPVPLDAVLPGDVLFFNTFGSGASHAGVYIGDGLFIHAASEGEVTGVVITPLKRSYWQKNFMSAGRFIHDESGVMYAEFVQKQESENERNEFKKKAYAWFDKYFDIELTAAPCFSLGYGDRHFSGGIKGGSANLGLRFDIADFYCGISGGLAVTSLYTGIPLRCFIGWRYAGVYYGLLPGVFYGAEQDTHFSSKVEFGIMCSTTEMTVFKQKISLTASWGIMRSMHDSFQFRDFYQDAVISAGVKIKLPL